MVRQLTKAFAVLTFLLLIPFMSISTVQAASSDVNEIQYIKTYSIAENGKDLYRIEIGLKSDLSDYKVRMLNSISNMLIIDLANTVPGKTQQANSGALSLSYNESNSIKEFQINQTRILLTMPLVVPKRACNSYVLPANRQEKLPYRLIIDVDKSLNANKSQDYNQNNQNNQNYNSSNNYDNDYEDEYGYRDRNNINTGIGSIVIDAGHGGSDSGAVGPNGVTEKSVTLAVAKKVQRLLEESGAPVVMTRTTDRDVASSSASNGRELQSRVDKTPSDALLFVSIHCNAFGNPNSHGMETYYYGGSYEGKKLATFLNEELARLGGRFNRGVKSANFYVIKHATVPASLVELAFITNPEEEYLLADEDYQYQLALAITRGIKRYLGLAPDANFTE